MNIVTSLAFLPCKLQTTKDEQKKSTDTKPLVVIVGAEVDQHGRVKVESDLTVAGHPNIFVIGDTARVMQNGELLPGLAPVAIQEGRYVAQVIADRVAGKAHSWPFRYVDKGTLATVGRSFAVADIGPLHFSGFLAAKREEVCETSSKLEIMWHGTRKLAWSVAPLFKR